ncbi:hypothetical protein ABH941_008230, partial [Streptacidiphilus sp. EB103A]
LLRTREIRGPGEVYAVGCGRYMIVCLRYPKINDGCTDGI